MLIRPLTCLTLLFATGLACAAKEESDVTSWLKGNRENAPAATEQEFSIPDLAKLKDWRVYKAGQSMGETRVEIAADSVTVGKDEILRYAIAIIPKSGLRNVFFEGIDCYTGRYRTYAWGNLDKTWRKTESANWRVANLNVRNVWQGEVIKDFCSFTGGALPAKTVIDALQSGSIPQQIR